MNNFSENIKSSEIVNFLSRSIPYYKSAWAEQGDGCGLFGSTDPEVFNMKSIGRSSPVIEYVVRPHVNILLILSVCVSQWESVSKDIDAEKEEIVSLIDKGFKWLVETHITGSKDVDAFLSKKRWGSNWRSGMWTGIAAAAFYFSSDILSEDVKRSFRELLAYEADRFTETMPPDGCRGDTKLTENATDTMLLAWALNILNDHENVPDWEKSLFRWSLNTATSIYDKTDHTKYLDSSVAKYTTTSTLFPDYTAESYGFFSPDIYTYSIWVVAGMAAFRLHDRDVPECFYRKVHTKVYDNLLRFTLPCGLLYSPSGNDYPLFLPRPFALAWGLWNQDSRAHRITSNLLKWMSKKIASVDGKSPQWVLGFEPAFEGWELLFQSIPGMELALLAGLPMQNAGGMFTMGRIEQSIDTNTIYPYIELLFRRNVYTSRSVAWKDSNAHPSINISFHRSPELSVAADAGMLGIPDTSPAISKWETMFHNDRSKKDGFDTFGRIKYLSSSGDHLLTRDIRVLTWDDEGLILFDTIRAEQDIVMHEQYLSPQYFLNDVWADNEILIKSGSLQDSVESSSVEAKPVFCPSFWVTLNDTMICQMIWGRQKGFVFVPANQKNHPAYWHNARVDMLAVFEEGGSYKKGETVYRSGFYTGHGKSPKRFKTSGRDEDFYKGLIIMDGRSTLGLDY